VISLHVKEREIVTIIGPNGAGKSTLLMSITGIVHPTGGSLLFEGKEMIDLSSDKRVVLGCVLVPEGRRVFTTLTVKENLELGAYLRHKAGKKEEVKHDLEHVYSLFPVLEKRDRQLAGTLSGGEQQMLAIGRALMARPKFLMMDEPSMGIAPVITQLIFKTIVKLREEGMSILLVEQNAKRALAIADRGYVIETGQFVLEGTREELLCNNDVQRAYLGKEYTAIND
jgi:branched-chain amino acid transport system ATP-binding protein